MPSETPFLNLDRAARRALEMGLPVVEHHKAATREEAATIAREIGYPVAMKVLSPIAVHKTEIGGVKLNLGESTDVYRAFEEINLAFRRVHSQAAFQGVTISPMLPPGLEAIVGLIHDRELGPAVMFGLGGVSVELFGDVTFRLPPLTRSEARRMIGEIRGYPLLTGYRGRSGIDLDALVDCLLTLSRFPEIHPMVTEVELNPLILYPEGCRAADVKLALIQE